MAVFKSHKLNTLPAQANPNDVLYVKNGSLVSMYICDSEGTPIGVIPAGDYVKKVNGEGGTVQLDLGLSGGVLSITGGNATINLDNRYFKAVDSLPWSQISDTPTTLGAGGYGITDAYTKAQVDAITGSLTNLQTSTKTNLVSAVNELLTSINNGLRIPQAIDCSANPNYPAAKAGDTFKVTVAGKIGGASGEVVQVNDQIICTATNGGGDQASVGASFYIIQGNIDSATTTVEGTGRIGTQAEVNTGTEDKAWVTPLTLSTLLTANYYTKTDTDAKYLTAEVDNLQSVTSRSNSTSLSITAKSGASTETTIGTANGITTDVHTAVGTWARGLLAQSDNGDSTKKIGTFWGGHGGAGSIDYSIWAIDGTDVSGISASAKSLRLYPDGSLYYGTPPANANAAALFLGLSSDGHTISTRTSSQVRADINAMFNTPTGDWDTIINTQRGELKAGGTNGPNGGTAAAGMYFPEGAAGYGSEIAIRNNRFYFRSLENSVLNDWDEVASRAWVADQDYISTETDPVWVAAKSASTIITGAWNFSTDIVTQGIRVSASPTYGGMGLNIGLGGNAYNSFFGGVKTTGATVLTFNAKPDEGADNWSQGYASKTSTLLQVNGSGIVQIYSAAAGAASGDFSTFWGMPKTIATTDVIPTFETDPVWTAAKAASTVITGAWNYTNEGTSFSGGLELRNRAYLGLADNARMDALLSANAVQNYTAGTWSVNEPTHASILLRLSADDGALKLYTAAKGSDSGDFDTFWGTAKTVATTDWVTSQIASATAPTLQQVTTSGATSDKAINLTNTGIGLVVSGGVLTPNAIQMGAAGSTGQGGFIQAGSNTSSAYGVLISNNAYWDGSNWIQPRGSLGSHIFGVTNQQDFTWKIAAIGTTDGGTITPAEIMNLNSLGTLTVPNLTLNSLDNSSGDFLTITTSTNKVRRRTALQVLADIGALGATSPAGGIQAADIINWNAAYAAMHAALSLGTTKSGLSLAGQVLSLALATTSADGAMSKDDKTKLSGIATGANNYTLPAATASVLGGVKIGSGLTIDAGGVLSNPNGTAYSLPTATASVLGGIKVGSTLKIASAVLDAKVATGSAAGIVKPGDNMAVDGNGSLTMEWGTIEW